MIWGCCVHAVDQVFGVDGCGSLEAMAAVAAAVAVLLLLLLQCMYVWAGVSCLLRCGLKNG